MASINVTYSDITASYDLPDEIGVEVIIGTSEDCSIDLPDVEGLADEHCCITLYEDGYALSDLGSGKGTFANDKPVENEYMAAGVSYRIGAAVLTFVPDEVAAPVETAPAVAEPAPDATQETAAAPQASAAPAKKTIRKTAKRTGGTGKPLSRPAAARSAQAAAVAAYNKKQEQINLAYVVLVLLAAFYAGMALYSWQHTGNPLPIFLR
ncbi:MAG: FHA domain-containing protein [Akkermansia sp.]|nr:FHA domain-containing protein [Akkermansia sp.]